MPGDSTPPWFYMCIPRGEIIFFILELVKKKDVHLCTPLIP